MADPSRPMTRSPISALLAMLLATGCASGAAGPPVNEPGAPPPTTASPPPLDDPPSQPGRPPEDSPEADPDAHAVGVRRLGRWDHSRFESPERQVLRDAAGLADLRSRLGGAELPPVDFARELVVVAAAGQKPSGGHTISVGRVTLKDGELLIEVVETTPDQQCMTTQALTQPVDVVALSAEGVRSWKFVERSEVGGC